MAAAKPVAIFLFLAYHRPVALRERFTIRIFRGSSAVEQVAVNHLVVGSNPTPGAVKIEACLSLYFC